MKAYKVNVNGNTYEITIEVIDQSEVQTAQPAPAATAPASVAAPAPAPAPAATPAGGTTINAPMPGTILKVNVANGQAVKKGDILLILEAMKMENEILAPCDGTVTGVNVQSGASVETGALLCAIG